MQNNNVRSVKRHVARQHWHLYVFLNDMISLNVSLFLLFLCGGCCTKNLLRLPGRDMDVYFEGREEEDAELYRLTSLL
mgnify:CR=1 FL=1